MYTTILYTYIYVYIYRCFDFLFPTVDEQRHLDIASIQRRHFLIQIEYETSFCSCPPRSTAPLCSLWVVEASAWNLSIPRSRAGQETQGPIEKQVKQTWAKASRCPFACQSWNKEAKGSPHGLFPEPQARAWTETHRHQLWLERLFEWWSRHWVAMWSWLSSETANMSWLFSPDAWWSLEARSEAR